MKNFIYYALIPILCAFIAAGYYKSEIYLMWYPENNYVGLTNQISKMKTECKDDQIDCIEQEQEHDIFIEEWNLILDGNNLIARISPKDLKTTWLAKGFSNNGFLSIAYKTELPKDSGIGSIFLEKDEGSDTYVGKLTAFDCTVKKVVTCPYILTPKSAEKATKKAYIDKLNVKCTETEAVIEKLCKS